MDKIGKKREEENPKTSEENLLKKRGVSPANQTDFHIQATRLERCGSVSLVKR